MGFYCIIIDGECRNENCLKGRGRKDAPGTTQKTGKEKIIRIWITIIRQGEGLMWYS